MFCVQIPSRLPATGLWFMVQGLDVVEMRQEQRERELERQKREEKRRPVSFNL